MGELSYAEMKVELKRKNTEDKNDPVLLQVKDHARGSRKGIKVPSNPSKTS